MPYKNSFYWSSNQCQDYSGFFSCFASSHGVKILNFPRKLPHLFYHSEWSSFPEIHYFCNVSSRNPFPWKEDVFTTFQYVSKVYKPSTLYFCPLSQGSPILDPWPGTGLLACWEPDRVCGRRVHMHMKFHLWKWWAHVRNHPLSPPLPPPPLVRRPRKIGDRCSRQLFT